MFKPANNCEQSLAELTAFLGSVTLQEWVDKAMQHQDILLIDHAHCEKKAAATAMQLMCVVLAPAVLHGVCGFKFQWALKTWVLNQSNPRSTHH